MTIPDSYFDYVIENNGTLDDLKRSAEILAAAAFNMR